MEREALIHLSATVFVVAATIAIIVAVLGCWLTRKTQVQTTFPPDYSAIEQAAAIVEHAWRKPRGVQ